jgi:hypothetical protein
MEEEQTHNGQKKKDKQRSEKNMHKTNDQKIPKGQS